MSEKAKPRGERREEDAARFPSLRQAVVGEEGVAAHAARIVHPTPDRLVSWEGVACFWDVSMPPSPRHGSLLGVRAHSPLPSSHLMCREVLPSSLPRGRQVF